MAKNSGKNDAFGKPDMVKPGTLDQAGALSQNYEGLLTYIRARLVWLAGRDENVAIRAIELLLSLGPVDEGDGLGDVSTVSLEQSQRRARAHLQRRGFDSDRPDDEP